MVRPEKRKSPQGSGIGAHWIRDLFNCLDRFVSTHLDGFVSTHSSLRLDTNLSRNHRQWRAKRRTPASPSFVVEAEQAYRSHRHDRQQWLGRAPSVAGLAPLARSEVLLPGGTLGRHRFLVASACAAPASRSLGVLLGEGLRARFARAFIPAGNGWMAGSSSKPQSLSKRQGIKT